MARAERDKMQDLLAKNERLRLSLREAEETLEAIRSGEVDALVVSGPHGEQVYTLTGSDQAYRLLFETMNEGAAILGSDGTAFFCNTKLSSMLKTPMEEILGGSMVRFVTTEDSPSFETLLNRGMEETQKKEIALKSHDGDIVPCQISTSPLQVEDSSHICMIVSDLTERKKAEDQLRESERRFREFVELLPEPLFETDAAGMITFVNRRALRMFGYDEADIEHGINVLDVFVPEERAKVRANFLRVVGTEDLGGNEYQCIRKDSTRFPSSIHSAAIVKGDAVVGATGIIIDLTERKKALDEQDHLRSQLFQSQKMEAIGTLAGGIAHDFNNILQVALGYSELILSDEELPRLHQADLQKIHESARRGADLVQRLLTFSRKTEIKPQPLNLNRRIQEMKNMLERTIPKMIEIKLSLGEDLATINADPTQLDQVLMNLAVNAKDAMPEGGKLVFETANVVLDEEYAASHPGAKPGRYVLLSVMDTGAGMDEETLRHIFEPFYTTKAVGEGTGLGLAMVHGIVHQHGGHIGCYSEPGEGTTFKFYFPVLAADEEPSDTAVRAIPRGGSETILLADDEEPIRDLCSRILSRAGYKVINASDGEEALDLYERRRDEISLVLLDLIMPKMGGKHCLESLLRLNPSVKVIIASGYSASGPDRDALSAEAKGFVNKPYNIQEVLNVVRTVLDEDMAQQGTRH